MHLVVPRGPPSEVRVRARVSVRVRVRVTVNYPNRAPGSAAWPTVGAVITGAPG